MSDRAKKRADLLLVERGLCESRAKAAALILAGEVFSAEQRVDKPGQVLLAHAPLTLRERPRYVSRGGDKLAHALAAFAAAGLIARGKVCVDVGASTGGFSDCLLQHGAAKIYAVDVGRGQLHPALRADPRVVARERTNARALCAVDFAERIDLVVVDASFIGLGALLPAIAAILPTGGELCALVKPQFEAGRSEVARGRGVIRDPEVRLRAIGNAIAQVEAAGFELLAAVDSALAGPKGNVEHFVYARRR